MNQPDRFDTALTRLTEITETLEKGESSLDNLVKLFEEGLELSVYCNQMLEQTEGKISRLLETMNGELVLNPHEEA
jgi:exodeoxyribonuclease VII small subunit